MTRAHDVRFSFHCTPRTKYADSAAAVQCAVSSHKEHVNVRASARSPQFTFALVRMCEITACRVHRMKRESFTFDFDWIWVCYAASAVAAVAAAVVKCIR